MSLRNFHLLFIALSVLCLDGFLVWCVLQQPPQYEMALGAVALSAFAMVYGVMYFKKTRG